MGKVYEAKKQRLREDIEYKKRTQEEILKQQMVNKKTLKRKDDLPVEKRLLE